MIIGSRPKLSKSKSNLGTLPSFQLGGIDIDLVNKTKFLGVMIDSQIRTVNQKISRAIGLLKYARNFVETNTMANLYRSIGNFVVLQSQVLQKLQNE